VLDYLWLRWNFLSFEVFFCRHHVMMTIRGLLAPGIIELHAITIGCRPEIWLLACQAFAPRTTCAAFTVPTHRRRVIWTANGSRGRSAVLVPTRSVGLAFLAFARQKRRNGENDGMHELLP
jgi:hypothetical protein